MPEPAKRPANPDIQAVPDEDQQVWIEPPYKVLIHNDSVTTFQFVERLLMSVFQKSEYEAATIAWQTHLKGLALVCVRPQGEADALARKGMFAARMEGFPLKLSTEPVV